MCFKQCRHVEITKTLKDIALEDEKNLSKQKGKDNPTTLPLNARRDYIGSIAQNCIPDFFTTYGMEGGLEMSPYYSSEMNRDEYDFHYRGMSSDVKSRPYIGEVYGNTLFWVGDHQRDKYVNYYVFVGVGEDKAHLAGYISYENFWEISEQAVGKWVKKPCHIIKASYLKDIYKMLV